MPFKMNYSLEDEIAAKTLSAYAILPPKIKPLIRATSREWVPLSGIVLESHGELTCVALGLVLFLVPLFLTVSEKGVEETKLKDWDEVPPEREGSFSGWDGAARLPRRRLVPPPPRPWGSWG